MERPQAIWQREQQDQPPIDVSPVPSLQWLVLTTPCNTARWQNRLAFLLNIGSFGWKQTNQIAVPGFIAQFNLQGFELDVKGGTGKYNSKGSFIQCKVSFYHQRFRSWLSSNHSLVMLWAIYSLQKKQTSHSISTYRKMWRCKDPGNLCTSISKPILSLCISCLLSLGLSELRRKVL